MTDDLQIGEETDAVCVSVWMCVCDEERKEEREGGKMGRRERGSCVLWF